MQYVGADLTMEERGLPTLLARVNVHERDLRIRFYEEPHIYSIDGDEGFTSVTTWNHVHFETFDADRIIEKMMSSTRWPKSKYYGKTPDEIKEGWEINRDAAAKAGTAMHYDIECYYNQCLPGDFDWLQCPERTYFTNFLDDWGHLEPYRTEWTVFHEELRLAGSIDMVFRNADGDLLIYDWKRSKGIVKTNPVGKFSHTECISHLPDSNFWHYSLQLNMYKHILEANYGVKVVGMFLICMHPENTNGNYQRIAVADLREEIADLCAFRKSELQGLK